MHLNARHKRNTDFDSPKYARAHARTHTHTHTRVGKLKKKPNEEQKVDEAEGGCSGMGGGGLIHLHDQISRQAIDGCVGNPPWRRLPPKQRAILAQSDGQVSTSAINLTLALSLSQKLAHKTDVFPMAGSCLPGSVRTYKADACASKLPFFFFFFNHNACLLYTSPSPRDRHASRMPSSA